MNEEEIKGLLNGLNHDDLLKLKAFVEALVDHDEERADAMLEDVKK